MKLSNIIYCGILPLSALAFNAIAAEQKEDPCAWVSSYSKTIMTARQQGKLMPDLMRVVNEGSYSVGVKNQLNKMIIDAYDAPRLMTDEMKVKMVVDFQNKNYLQCVKSGQNL